MKTKNLYLLILILLYGIRCYGQTITPSQTSPFCPETSTLFDVTLSGRALLINVVGLDYATVLQLPYSNVYNSGNNTTTFKFRGKFGDINVSQKFKVFYQEAGANKSYEFVFNKIRSFFSAVEASIPKPSPKSITAAPCTSQNFSISFPKVKYANSSMPKDTFGVVSVYEYSLPIGWKLNNGTSSTGLEDWKIGTNNVVITSDADHGNNGKIYVRGVNSCGSNLIKGPLSYITITRPAPSLSFNYQNPLCNSYTFTANNVPSWITNRLWESIPSNFVNISNPNSNSTLISKISDGASGGLRFTISSTNCPSLVYVYNTSQIITNHTDLETGVPRSTWPEVFYPADGYLTYGYNVTYQTTSQSHFGWYRWGYYEGLTGGNLTMVNPAGFSTQAIRIQNTEQYNRIYLVTENTCGVGYPNIRVFEFHSGPGIPDVEYARVKPAEEITEMNKNEFRILGNPVKETLTINLPGEPTKGRKLTIIDINGKVVKHIDPFTNVLRIEVGNLKSGLYHLRFVDNANVQTLSFIKD